MERTRVYKTNENYLRLRKIVYFILGILEILFAFRLVFKLLGASHSSAFVSLIYSLSGFFQAPFDYIFRTAIANGIETRSVLEPATIIAMIVYALIAYGIVQLIRIVATPSGGLQLESEKETGNRSFVTKFETTEGTQLRGEGETETTVNKIYTNQNDKEI
jgi:hypothetical protein